MLLKPFSLALYKVGFFASFSFFILSAFSSAVSFAGGPFFFFFFFFLVSLAPSPLAYESDPRGSFESYSFSYESISVLSSKVSSRAA